MNPKVHLIGDVKVADTELKLQHVKDYPKKLKKLFQQNAKTFLIFVPIFKKIYEN